MNPVTDGPKGIGETLAELLPANTLQICSVHPTHNSLTLPTG